MSMFSELFKKAMHNKTLGKVAGGISTPLSPLLALGDVAGKSIKGLDNPFIKGASQGARIGLGTGAAVAGGMLAAGAGAGATGSGWIGAGSTLPSGGVVTTAGQIPATAAATPTGGSSLLSSLLQNSGGSGQVTPEQKAQWDYIQNYRSRYNQI